eukprot:207776_1
MPLSYKQKAALVGCVAACAVYYRKRQSDNAIVVSRNRRQSYFDPRKRRRRKVGLDREFFIQFRKIIKIVLPTWRSKEALLVLLHTSSLVARTFLSIYVAKLDGSIVKSIVEQRFRRFLWLMSKWIGVAIPATYINSMIRYLENKLAIAFRTRLVHHVYDLYMKNDSYYAMGNLDSRIKNPDQCMTDDVENFTTSLAHLYSQLSKPLLDVVLMTAQLTFIAEIEGDNRSLAQKYSPHMLSTVVFTATYYILRFASPPFGRLVAEKAHKSGVLRALHSRLIIHAEEVAFYRGHHVEKKVLLEAYTSLVRHLNTIYKKRIFYTMLEQFLMKYVWSSLGMLIVAMPTFHRNRNVENVQEETNIQVAQTQSERTQTIVAARGLLVGVADAIERMMSSYKDLTELAGYTARVSELLTVLDDLQLGKYKKRLISGQKNIIFKTGGGKVSVDDNLIELSDVPILTPNGDVLVKSLSLKIAPGDHLLITGPNGCGKSSFFRILGGLWPVKAGKLTRPGPGKMFYIPQRPYFTQGTLRQQITYPVVLDVLDNDDRDKLNQSLLKILEDVHLSYVVEREGGWDTENDWQDVLSGGEKQRLAMARMFYHRPRFAILDECTSAVSMDVEGAMYLRAKDLDITLLTVSHRPSLWKYHDHVLKFDGDGGWTFEPMSCDKMMGLQEEKEHLEAQLQSVPQMRQRFADLCGQLGVDPGSLNLHADQALDKLRRKSAPLSIESSVVSPRSIGGRMSDFSSVM